MAHASSWPAWLAEPDRMIDRLRAAHLAIGVGDELRLRVLLHRLAEVGAPADGVESAARWLGPILCRNADQQQTLVSVLQQIDGEQASKPLLAPATPPQTAQEAAIARQRKRNLWKIGLWFAAAALLIAALSAWLLLWPAQEVKPPPEPVVTPTCVPPDCKPDDGVKPPPPKPSRGPWWTVGLGLIPITVVLTFLMVRQRRRVFLLRGLVPRQEPTLTRMLPARSDGLFRADRMRVPTADWRRHRWEDSHAFDPIASVARTVRTAGEPTIVTARRRILPKYLLLVDRTGANDLLAAIADHLMARLKAEQIDVARFDYRGDPRHLTAVDGAGGRGALRTLQELRSSHDEHQLIVLADAASAFDRATRQPRVWLSLLCQWPQPILMSPLPVPHHGAAERRMADLGFKVVEASSEGVAAIGRLMRRDDRSAWRYMAADEESTLDAILAADAYRWTGDQAPSDGEVDALIKALEKSLDPKAFILLATIAVFPMTDARLTLYAGGQLTAALQWHHGLEGLLAEIGRLPWLRQGYVPEWLRVALVEWLEHPQRQELARTVRSLWLALLADDTQSSGNAGQNVRFDFAQAYTPTMSERLLAAVRAKKDADVEERVLIAFLTNTPVHQVVLEAPVTWQDLAPKRWRTADIIVVGLGVAAAAALAGWSASLTALLDSLSLDQWGTYLMPPAWVALSLSSLVVMQSYLRQLSGPWSRLLGGITGSILCALAVCFAVFMVAVIGIKRESSWEAGHVAFVVPAIAYVTLWLNPSSFGRLGERALMEGLFVRSPAVGAALATLLACALALVTADAVGAVTSWGGVLKPAGLPFLSSQGNTWLHLVVLLSVFATFAATAIRIVQVSPPQWVLVAYAVLHVLGALAIVSVFDNLIFEVIESHVPGWKRTASPSIVFVLALAVCVPFAVARWRDLDRTVIRFAYRFALLAIVLELARAAIDGLDTSSPGRWSDSTLKEWTPGVFVWSIPVLSILGLIAADRNKTGRRPVALLAVLYLWAFLAGGIWLCSRNGTAFGQAETYVRFYVIPALSLGLELGTLPLIMVLASSRPKDDQLLPRFGQPLPSLRKLLQRTVAIGWPALSTALAVVVVGAIAATNIPRAPPPSVPTPPSTPSKAANAFTVFFSNDESTLSQQALSTINQAAMAFKGEGSEARVQVRGYTDTSLEAAAAMALSLRRANAVKDALAKEGVPAQSITVIGYGSSNPLVPTGPNVREPQNQRVVIDIAPPSASPAQQTAPAAPSKK
jgi:outer membrane protein OmpA-like peptidoglycan-associated protein